MNHQVSGIRCLMLFMIEAFTGLCLRNGSGTTWYRIQDSGILDTHYDGD